RQPRRRGWRRLRLRRRLRSQHPQRTRRAGRAAVARAGPSTTAVRAAMTEPARRRGDLAVPVATAAVTAAATAAVAWAAATPPATLSASATAPPASAAADQAHAAAATRRAGRDVWRAQRTLAAVRADLTRLMRV